MIGGVTAPVGNLSQLTSLQYLDVALAVSNKATNLLGGGGYVLEAVGVADKDNLQAQKINNFLKDFEKYNRLSEFFAETEQMLSLYGVQIPVISVRKNKQIILSNTDPNLAKMLARIDKDEVSATLGRQWKNDLMSIKIREDGDLEKVTRTFYNNTNEIIGGYGTNTIMPKGFTIEPVWYHGLGVLPLTYMTNKAGYIYNDNSMVRRSELADTFPARNLQHDLNESFVSKIRERRKGQTYLVGNVDNTTKSAILNQNYLPNDFFLHSNSIKSDGSTYLDIIKGDPPLEAYNKDIEIILKRAFEFSGYSYMMADEHAQQDSATGKLITKGLDVSTTKMKKALRTQQGMRLLDKVLMVAKLGDGRGKRPYRFEILDNIVIDEAAQLNAEQQKLTMGITSRAEVRATIYRTTYEQAQEDIKRIDEEEMENPNKADSSAPKAADMDAATMPPEPGKEGMFDFDMDEDEDEDESGTDKNNENDDEEKEGE